MNVSHCYCVNFSNARVFIFGGTPLHICELGSERFEMRTLRAAQCLVNYFYVVGRNKLWMTHKNNRSSNTFFS